MINLRQLEANELKTLKIDFFIASSGFESRAITQAAEYSQLAKKRIALAFNSEMDDEIRKYNDKFLTSLEFSLLILNAEESTNLELSKIVAEIELHAEKYNSVAVYIDYSSMTRNWYSYLLYCLFNSSSNGKTKVYFGYSHAEFVPSESNQTLNRIVSPLYGYCDLCVPSKPTALIIGLGNEPNRIYGLKEYFDAVPYLFYSDKSYNEKYSDEIENSYQEIFTEINPNHIFRFPIHDLVYTSYILKNLCLRLLKEYRVVIAPCGPKPFGLLAMINSLNHDDSIEVWRISPGSKINKIDRKPTGLISAIELTFLSNVTN